MDGRDKTNELINAMGALAEMAYVFMKAAANAGANRDELLLLTTAYIKALVGANQKKGDEDET